MKRLPNDPAFWFLEGFLDASGRVWRMALPALPLRIGRHPSCGLVLNSDSVSSRHAELFDEGEGIWVRDLGSRNGTYVNRQLIAGPVELKDGDILHFANREFRLSRHRPPSTSATLTGTLRTSELTHLLEDRGKAFDQLMADEAIGSLLQPIQSLPEASMIGWELLTNGPIGGEVVGATELFLLAEELGQAVAFSRFCRDVGVRRAAQANPEDRRQLFVNTHPQELARPDELLDSVAELRELAGNLELVLELHESAFADVERLRDLSRRLRSLGVSIAFDDFGIGQSRLLELATSPPDYLKFAKQLIQGIDQAAPERLALVRSLVAMAEQLGCQAVAEGIETPAELGRCQELGFRGAQGYLIGLPAALVVSA